MKLRVTLTAAAVALVLAACGTGSDGDTRTIQVRAFDDMRFDPAEFDVDAGQTIRFEVSNEGQVRHDFFIGTIAEQEEHAAEMEAAGHGEDAHGAATDAGIEIEPGETEVLEYTFSSAGTLYVGCHEPGHYDAGMTAVIRVH